MIKAIGKENKLKTIDPASQSCTPLLHTLLHGLNMRKIQRVLTQTPRHNTPDLLLIHNVLELALDHLRSVPRPEKVLLAVEIVLPAGLFVQLPVLVGAAP